MKDKIRILHMGDVHLDSPFSALGVDKSESRRRELRGTFTSILYLAKEKNIDLVLISGDLFDDGYATGETVELLCSQFAALPDCRFVVAPGNHDPYTRGSRRVRWRARPPTRTGGCTSYAGTAIWRRPSRSTAPSRARMC